MSLQKLASKLLEPYFSFLLNFPPALSVVVYGTLVLFLINIFYKILINQNDARQIKQRSKELNKEMQQANKEKNTERSKKLLDELLAENNRLMKLTMKPMLTSFIIVIVMLPVLSGLYGDKFVELADNKGAVKLNDVSYQLSKTANTVTVGDVQCELPCTQQLGDYSYKIMEESDKIKFAPIVAITPAAIPLIGDTFGWLGWYIITSIPIAFLLRKMMKIYI